MWTVVATAALASMDPTLHGPVRMLGRASHRVSEGEGWLRAYLQRSNLTHYDRLPHLLEQLENVSVELERVANGAEQY